MQTASPLGKAAFLIVADDLTGACDASAPLSSIGEFLVTWSPSEVLCREQRCLAITTDSRQLSADAARDRVSDLVRQTIKWRPRRVIKKIDSTLKGHPGAEIEALLSASQAEIALVCPANPAQGRAVIDGMLRAKENGHTVDVASALSHETTLPIRCFGIPDALEMESLGDVPQPMTFGEPEIWVFDALTQRDIDRVAMLGGRVTRSIIEVGSAGLTKSIARKMSLKSPLFESWHSVLQPPLIFVVGSDNTVATSQVQHLVDKAHVPIVDMASSSASDELALSPCCVVRLHPHRSTADVFDKLTRAVRRFSQGTLLLTGGDTATAFCKAAGISCLRVMGQFIDGIPCSVPAQHELCGWSIVTKAGGFGDPCALVKLLCTVFRRSLTL